LRYGGGRKDKQNSPPVRLSVASLAHKKYGAYVNRKFSYIHNSIFPLAILILAIYSPLMFLFEAPNL